MGPILTLTNVIVSCWVLATLRGKHKKSLGSANIEGGGCVCWEDHLVNGISHQTNQNQTFNYMSVL